MMKNRTFRNAYHQLIGNIHYTNNYIVSEFQKKLVSFDLSTQQYIILKLLAEVQPDSMTVSELKERMIDRNSDMTRLIDRLVKKGLVVREIDPANRRQVNLRLSEQATGFISEIISQFQNFESIVSHLSEEEVRTLNELLNKIRNH